MPDLATTVPEPTDGGRTYTFHLRKGVRYSTGAPVLAGDIRRGIERTVAHGTTRRRTTTRRRSWRRRPARRRRIRPSPPRSRSPDCDLSRASVADDRTGTITFHLTRSRRPEFVYQLALPNASAVPQDTPLDLPPGTFVPATGPYMIALLHAEAGTRRTAMDGSSWYATRTSASGRPPRNPPATPTGSCSTTGYTEAEAVARVIDGRADLSVTGQAVTDVDRLGTRYGSQLHTTPGLSTEFVFLNTTTPPFDNLDRPPRRRLRSRPRALSPA